MIYIFLENDKNKSNYWIYLYLRKYLKKFNENKIKFKFINFKKTKRR